MTNIKMSEINAELDNVDSKDALERAKNSPAFRIALEMSRPRNWWGIGIPPERLLKFSKEDGIPIAWVPPKDLLIELDLASDREERLTILRRNRDKVINHCESILLECTDQWIADEQYLALKALETLQVNHHEAALALAVIVGEPLALWASKPQAKAFTSEKEKESWDSRRKNINKYLLVDDEIDENFLEAGGKNILRKALVAPIQSFFQPFWAEKGDEIPEKLSRHAVVHSANRKQYTPDNALLALMLVSSILYQMQLWCEEVRDMDRISEL